MPWRLMLSLLAAAIVAVIGYHVFGDVTSVARDEPPLRGPEMPAASGSHAERAPPSGIDCYSGVACPIVTMPQPD